MQTHHVGKTACVYKRVKKGRRRKSFEFERKPALKIEEQDGTVLLRPLPAAPPVVRQSPVIVTLTEGVTAQLAAKPNGSPQEPKAPRNIPRRNNGGSAQWSPLIIGIGKHLCVGRQFKF